MNKMEFLKLSFEHKAYANKEWLIAVLTIGFDDPENKAILSKVPYAPWIEDNKFQFFDHENKLQTLNDDVTDVIFNLYDPISLPGDFHPVLKGEATETIFGLFLFNTVMIYEAVGDLIPYINQEFTKPLLMKHIEEIMCDELPDTPIPEGKAGIKKCLEITRNNNYLEGILSNIVKCGSHDALTVSPLIIKRKNELLKLHKDNLSDPVVFNQIVEELVDLDIEIQKKGDSNTFYISKDYISNCRKRMFIMFGIEFNSESGTWVPIVDPLTKGWDPKLMVDYINTAIEGAYNRGKATGEGGARVKDILRIIASAHRSEDDCGSWLGDNITLFKSNIKNWFGTHIVEDKKLVMLDESNASKYVGKKVVMRAPQFCLTQDGNYCKNCLGKGLGTSQTRVASDVTKIPTGMMLQRMKSSHISGTSNSEVDLEQAFR